jgi:hypothetical protein
MQAVDALANEAARPDFTPHLLDMTASLEATTRQTTIRTHNVIGRLPGRHPEAGAVLLLAHWDHFGLCGAGKPGAPIRVGARMRSAMAPSTMPAGWPR